MGSSWPLNPRPLRPLIFYGKRRIAGPEGDVDGRITNRDRGRQALSAQLREAPVPREDEIVAPDGGSVVPDEAGPNRGGLRWHDEARAQKPPDRKSTRLNSSHANI